MFIPVRYQHKMFISLCLSLHACLLCLCGWYLCTVCLFVCLSLLFLIRSQQSVARWELSLSTFCLLIPQSLFPPMWNTDHSSCQPNKLCHLPSQDTWDMTLIPSLFPPFPSRKKPPVPILGHPDEKTILGTPPHSFQKTNTKLLTCRIWYMHWMSYKYGLSESKSYYLWIHFHVNIL